jgi:hypothetical protein
MMARAAITYGTAFMDNQKKGKPEKWNDGTLKNWNDGTLKNWNDGTMGYWNIGKLE